MKTGRLTIEERDYIKMNFRRLSYTEMATKLDRRMEPIKKYVERTLGQNLVGVDEKASKAEFDIKRRPYWKDLEKQFSKDELEMLVFHWKRAMSQFKDDIFSTEEIQILDAIKLEILQNRLLIQQQESMIAIEGFQAVLKLEKEKPTIDQDPVMLVTLQEQVASLLAAQESIGRNYQSLQQEKNKLFRESKATREQRIKRLEESSTSFVGWLTEVLNNPMLRRELGLRMEKMRLATLKERDRLSDFHQYGDGSLDRPLLSCDTVNLGDS